MNLFKKIFKQSKKSTEKHDKSNDEIIGGLSIKLSSDRDGVSISSYPVGTLTGK